MPGTSNGPASSDTESRKSQPCVIHWLPLPRPRTAISYAEHPGGPGQRGTREQAGRRARCVPDRTVSGVIHSRSRTTGHAADLRQRCSPRPRPEPSKLVMRVRFPSSALILPSSCYLFGSLFASFVAHG
jgi:hypothetical protein